MKRKYQELAMIVLVLFCLLSGACSPQELEAIRYALNDAVIFCHNGVYYGVVYVFGRIFYAEVTTTFENGLKMSIYQVDQSLAFGRVKLLQKLGATRLSWATMPPGVKQEIWNRVQQFGSGKIAGGMGSVPLVIIIEDAVLLERLDMSPVAVQ